MNEKLLTFADADNLSASEAINLYGEHISPGQIELLKNFGFGQEKAVSSLDCWITLSSGKVVLDMTGGFGVLSHGHNHPRISSVREQVRSKKYIEFNRLYFSRFAAALAKNISTLLPGDLNISFFPNSGAEANEGALKLAFKFHNGHRSTILHACHSFHGKSIATGSITDSPEVAFSFQKLQEVDSFDPDNVSELYSVFERNQKSTGESNVYAVIIEPFSASLCTSRSEEFLKELRRLCDATGAILIFDEVYSGWGRTGSLFYFTRYTNLVPDILTYSKAFGGGKASISGYTTRKSIYEIAYGRPTDSLLHSTTYFGFGEETATALEAVNIVIEDNYADKAKLIEQHISGISETLKSKHKQKILSFRGAGAHWGIQIRTPNIPLKRWLQLIPSSILRDPRFIEKLCVSSIIFSLYKTHDTLTFAGFNSDILLIISPPLTIKIKELEHFFNGLDSTLNKTWTELISTFVAARFL